MSDETPFDWVDDGVLWLINRVVFHPRGFALTLTGAGEWFLQGDGSEAWTFDNDTDDEKFAAVEALLRRAAGGDLDQSAPWEKMDTVTRNDAQTRYGTIEDGFGSEWVRCGPNCDLQVVRPGKVQCNATDEGCPNRE